MEQGICLMPVIPLRKEPNDRSEMLTQVLFGETVRIFDEKQSWYSVETDLDKYPGWVADKQITRLTKEDYTLILESTVFLTKNTVSPLSDSDKEVLLLPAGSCLPGLKDETLTIAGNNYHFAGEARRFATGSEEELIAIAHSFNNAPYLWGGKTVLGIDCSGLTQVVFRLNGINIPRDARQQASMGEPVSLLSEARPGDLAFFDNAEGDIVHVGLIVDTNSIIHASGKVRKDLLDHHGIYNIEQKKYSHKLRLIRRVRE